MTSRELKVLHLEDNPAARAAKAHREETKRKLQALTEENKRLTQQVRPECVVLMLVLVLMLMFSRKTSERHEGRRLHSKWAHPT